MNKLISGLPKCISLGIIAWVFCFYCFSQYQSNTTIWAKLISIEKDASLSNEKKVNEIFILKKEFEDRKLVKDSVYARILHKAGLYEYFSNGEVVTNDAIIFTLAAIRINSAGGKNNSPAYCVNSYNNLAVYYKSLRIYNIASQYYDSALLWRDQFYVPEYTKSLLILSKAQMLYKIGDYQKAIEELTIGVQLANKDRDSALLPALFDQRAQSYIMQGYLQEALLDVKSASNFLQLSNNSNEMINNILLKADIFAKQHDFTSALLLYKRGIKQRLQTSDYNRISDDYTDLGNIYLNDLKNYAKAKECYLNTIKYALKAEDVEKLSKGHLNLEQCNFRQRNYKAAEQFCIEALKDLKVTVSSNTLTNPTALQLRFVGNKELILFILGNKTELLLTQFIETNDKKYLSACLQTAMLTDTLITFMRHEQLGEQSKLYWRTRTREFFTHAMEACYLAHNPKLTFHFMEKSQAVLLNDKLNELGALAQLPQAEAVKERDLQIAVLTEQQKLSSFISEEPGYEAQLSKLSEAKADLEHYIKSLEKKYLVYYQYKYADEVPPLYILQKQLTQKKQSFVHYFINDTVAYILCITPNDTKMEKLSKNDFNTRSLINFSQLCSYEPTLNNQFLSFASLSHSLYKVLFQPLKIPQGKVVICPDNFLIPFEALCTDNSGNNFLINDYIFSYVYSARYLLKTYNTYPPQADFIGFAPASFKAYSNIADLKQSGDALKQAAKHYNNSKLFTNNLATRHNFLSAVSHYTIVNVFSHARADTTENEPILYMYDSVIYLSELQLLHNPATKLVVLSACQTSVGRNATGEGILSLARGFALAGIPSVAATLWKADEQTIYKISEKFHEYLSQGVPKDEALQKAKLYFIENSEYEKPPPYYWANMILVGNEEPVKLSENHPIWWWVGGILFIIAVALFIVQFLRKRMA